jgi:deoxyribodipyrimidine photo-lyase
VTGTRRAIAWLRRDLRLHDSAALSIAATTAARAWPVFVADPALLARHAGAPGRAAWFGATLRALDARLAEGGSGVTVLVGPPEDVLPRFAARVGADVVIAARDPEPAAGARDARVARAVELRLVDDQHLVPADALRTGDGRPYTVFTPFRRALEAWLAAHPSALAEMPVPMAQLAPRPAEDEGPARFPAPEPSVPLPEAGERAARRRLDAFRAGPLARYAGDRDRPDVAGTSGLSVHLRTGAIGVRAAWRAGIEARDRADAASDRAAARGADAWLGELAWREFFGSLLAAFPESGERAMRDELDGIAWEEGPAADELLAAWRDGMTGIPMVDAGMRELAATGQLHNRLRLVTASYLVKHLGIDWRRGETVFMERLLDGDLAQNAGNWQWVAGTGADAAPSFRVFNPIRQGQRFDPDGAYVRRWVPALDALPPEHVHEPWRAPAAERPADYPPPIADLAEGRARALARYAAARAAARGTRSTDRTAGRARGR